jgi:hypothetical protein
MDERPHGGTDLLDYCLDQVDQGNTRPFIEEYVKVRDKQGGIVPFRFYRIIDHIDAHQGYYALKVKPRQVFSTTYDLATLFTLTITQPGFHCAIVAHEREATERLLRRAWEFYDLIPAKMQPALETERGNWMGFGGHLKSMLYIGTAGGRKFGRSETIQAAVLSEFAHYTERDAEEIWTGLPEAIPIGGRLYIESTPNGIGNLFHDLYRRAQQGKLKYNALFYPWFWHEEFTIPADSPEALPEDRAEVLEYTEDELELMALHGADAGQIRWRRSKMEEKRLQGDRELFFQEYPEDDANCFLVTSRSVFDRKSITSMLHDARRPLDITHNGSVKIYLRPRPGRTYVAGADPAEGIPGGDGSCVVILDGTTGEEAAVIHGELDPESLADLTNEVGAKYGYPLVVPERNNHGHTYIRVLREKSYPRIYRHREKDGLRIQASRHGFPTSQQSKSDLVTRMRRAVVAGQWRSHSYETLIEMMEFQADMEGSGTKFGAPKGQHDDRVIANMLANFGREQPMTSGAGGALPGAHTREQVSTYPAGLFT